MEPVGTSDFGHPETDTLKESKPICFRGQFTAKNGKRRLSAGALSNIPNTPDALGAYLAEDAVEPVYVQWGLYRTKCAHYDVMCENYILKLQIESRTLGEMVVNHILPAVSVIRTNWRRTSCSSKELGLPGECL